MCFECDLVEVFVALKEEEKVSRSVDDYDRSVRELQFERRGHAVDRMKTEEELAAEVKERLEKLEVSRCAVKNR